VAAVGLIINVFSYKTPIKLSPYFSIGAFVCMFSAVKMDHLLIYYKNKEIDTG
jgi:hypothetical protein